MDLSSDNVSWGSDEDQYGWWHD